MSENHGNDNWFWKGFTFVAGAFVFLFLLMVLFGAMATCAARG